MNVPDGFEHSYYTYPIQYLKDEWGINRNTFAKAMDAEGFPIGTGYQNQYTYYQCTSIKVYNQTTFPFSLIEDPVQDYVKGICSVTERMYEESLVLADVCRLPFTPDDISDFLYAIEKIWLNRDKLYSYEKIIFLVHDPGGFDALFPFSKKV